MTIRSLHASALVVCSIASVFVPAEASARAGGLTISRGPIIRSPAPRPALQSSVHIPARRALATKSAAVPSIHASHVTPAKRYRRIFGPGLPLNGVGVYYGPIYSPGNFTEIVGQYPTMEPVADMPPLPDGDVAAIGRRCGPQAFVVPSEAGGERTVTVTRCSNE